MILIKLIIFSSAMLSMLVWERLRPFTLTNRHSLVEYCKNLALLAVNIFVSKFMIIPITGFITYFNFWERSSEANLSVMLLDILLLDFWIYWWHRLMHRSNFLWRFHQIHHLDETLDTSSAIRFHFGEVILSAFARAPIILIFSIPLAHIIAFEAFLLICSFFHHANIGLPNKLDKLLSKIIVTPSIHWIHHKADPKDMHTNFCLFISIWDRIFNTSSTTKRTKKMNIGLPKQKDKDLLGLLLLPFQKS